jgi:hypothetical protein
MESLERRWPVAGRPRIERVTAIAQLYADTLPMLSGPAGSEEDLPPLLSAMQLSELYHAHYYHAAPFRREILIESWHRCEEDPERRETCIRAREKAERVLGPLGTDAPR